MMLLAVFKKVQYKLLMHRLAQMNVRFALMNSKRCNSQIGETSQTTSETVGPPGPRGDIGPAGPQGPIGPRGEKGPQG